MMRVLALPAFSLCALSAWNAYALDAKQCTELEDTVFEAFNDLHCEKDDDCLLVKSSCPWSECGASMYTAKHKDEVQRIFAQYDTECRRVPTKRFESCDEASKAADCLGIFHLKAACNKHVCVVETINMDKSEE